jgi:molybdopterin adenylyltransferase
MKPHGDLEPQKLSCGIVTISDTRTMATDKSGQTIRELLTAAGHLVKHYVILPDEPDRIRQEIAGLPALDVVLLNGGTGIAPRDRTFDAIAGLLEKELPGFGEIFRMLSYGEVGSRAMASRAIAGTIANRVIFSMPGSSQAVRLAMEQLILPEIGHLVRQLRGS